MGLTIKAVQIAIPAVAAGRSADQQTFKSASIPVFGLIAPALETLAYSRFYRFR